MFIELIFLHLNKLEQLYQLLVLVFGMIVIMNKKPVIIPYYRVQLLDMVTNDMFNVSH